MRTALALQRLIIRTGTGPGGALWQAVHRGLIRVLAAWLRAGTGAAVYVRGSFGRDEAVPGLSDLDLVVIAPDSDGGLGLSLVGCRRRRLGDVAPALGRMVTVVAYTPAELAATGGAIHLTHGLEGGGGAPRSRALHLRSHAPADELGLRFRPPLETPVTSWRRVVGPELLPAVPVAEGSDRLGAAWLELQYWWRHACRLVREPDGLTASYMCVKLVAEPARALLWLEQKLETGTRRDSLECLREAHPEEAESVEAMLGIERDLPRSGTPPIALALGSLTRTSARTAAILGARAHADGADRVELVWDDSEARGGGDLPLLDWRARVLPLPESEVFRVLPGSPSDPETLRAAGGGAPHQALAGEGLLVLATADQPLRGVECAVTDPVSFALVGGRSSADFPRLPGWSARDAARRAVNEHAAWLDGWNSQGAPPSERALGLLLTAGRSALFLESVEAGRPQLPLTVAATAGLLGDVAQGALEELRACRLEERPPSPEITAALLDLVGGLPSYST